MSIIAEALKKVEKEKDKTVSSRDYMNKVLGPERKSTYRKEELSAPPAFDNAGQRRTTVSGRTLAASGALIVLAIMFLTAMNMLFLPAGDIDMAARGDILEAEAYSDMGLEIGRIDNTQMDYLPVQILSNFKLNGIVWGADDSWAIINDEIVRTGDTLDGAKVVSIKPQKVVLSFKNAVFDLVVK